MVYLDYSATTPVLYEVLESYNKATKEYMGNTNSLHLLGIKASELLDSATKQVADILGINPKEIIYTSGATEANNLAIKGVAFNYKERGKHIIVSKLEHPSTVAVVEYLETLGFEIDYVNHDVDGLIDIEQLKNLIRKDTILVSITCVNSELGIRQPLKTLRQIIKKLNPNILIHSDMTQALGKVRIDLKDVDLASFSGHKIYGPKGIGILYKAEGIELTPVIHGSSKKSDVRPGTVPLPLIVAMSKAIRICTENLNEKEELVKRHNLKIAEALAKYEYVKLNTTKYSIPHILNITVENVRPETFIHALEEFEVYVGTNTACSTGDISSAVLAVFNDRKRALSTIRISISHLTTTNEVARFLEAFDNVYKKLTEIEQL